jgi:hypothetical protein
MLIHSRTDKAEFRNSVCTTGFRRYAARVSQHRLGGTVSSAANTDCGTGTENMDKTSRSHGSSRPGACEFGSITTSHTS